ncbi:MAG: alpha/beta fold hydrolase [Nitrospira sp.]|nr:alpha/beta fold hydrolase [Nitrospira sp.]
MNAIDVFTPALLLRNPHLMTLVPWCWPRNILQWRIPQIKRLFTTEPGTQLVGLCHWQSNRATSPTIIMVHGLEGCAESHYMRGITAKAYRLGFNIVRMNQRTCGGTDHLTPTLYNSGLSSDYRSIVRELTVTDRLRNIWLVGYSMGGNLVLKAAGELGGSDPALAGVVAVSPTIDPSQCVAALEQPRNRIYHWHFLSGLKARMCRKARLFPGKWDLSPLRSIKTISQFDDCYTARDGGYANGVDYYDHAGARHVLHKVVVPTLIIAAQDDPFIPTSIFDTPTIRDNPNIAMVMPRYGGHCGFFQKCRSGEDRFWAEHRIMALLSSQSRVG